VVRARGAAFLVLLAVTAAPADAVLCRKKSGAVFERDACRRKETALDPASIGAVGAPGPAGAPGTAPPRVRVVDAGGQRLPGTLISSGELLLEQGDAVVGIYLGRTGGSHVDRLYFGEAACAGTPLIAAQSDALHGAGILVGTTLYVGIGAAAERQVQAQRYAPTTSQCSGADTYDPISGTCCDTFTSFTLATRVAMASTFAATPPFTLELEE
jgi:hypothetical protein